LIFFLKEFVDACESIHGMTDLPTRRFQTTAMKTSLHSSLKLLAPLIGAALLSNADLQAQAWQTVDLFQLVPNLSAAATDIGTGADGTTLYTVGNSITSSAGYFAGVVRMSIDSGASWTTLDTFLDPNPTWVQATYRAFGSGADGTLFAAGELWDGGTSSTGTKTWIVRQSIDAGATWATVDAFYQGATAKPSCTDVKVNPYTGDVFAVGVGNTSSSTGFFWAVRKRAAGSQSFTTVDMVGAPPVNEARAVGFHPTAGIFVVGHMGNGTRDVWTVRRSQNGGATWTTVDTFQDSANTYSEARGITVSDSGAIYVCGHAGQVQTVKRKTTTINNWVVRRSLDGGTTWSVVDRFGAEPITSGAGTATATAITLAPSGSVFVTGYSPAPKRLLVRKGTTAANGTMSWASSDDYQLVSGQNSSSQAITGDLAGNIFTAGSATIDSSQLGYFLTRKLTGPQ
jgi:hypothetical protein